MNERRRVHLRNAGLAGGIATAVAASVCCIGPILAATLGLTSLGAMARYESLRPWFGAMTVAFLAVAFVVTYRDRHGDHCQPGSLCEIHGADRVKRLNRVVLWIATIIAAVALTFPTWSNWILG
jgi:mercuric ion transport protein